jgi:hypothetical protein
MKTLKIVLSIALTAIALSSDFAPAFASRMNGKCCMSSDGGRSTRYRRVMAFRAMPKTCSAYAAYCVRVSRNREDEGRACYSAKFMCMATGVHVGPYSGVHVAGLERR